jgi:hypothetical protein
MLHPAIATHQAELIALCRRFGVRRLEAFGSAARGDDFSPPDSDADLLVELAPEQATNLNALLDFHEALEATLGRRVDLLDRQALLASRNYIRRNAILAEAQPIYVA